MDETMDNQQERPVAIDLAWLAGAWEADGCVVLHKHKQAGGKKVYYQYEPSATFVNTDPVFIKSVMAVLKRMEIGFHQISRFQTGLGTKMIHQIQVQGMKRSKKFFDYLIPYMRSEKRDKAVIIKEYIDQRLKKVHGSHYDAADHAMWDKYLLYKKLLQESSETNMPDLSDDKKIESDLHREIAEDPK